MFTMNPQIKGWNWVKPSRRSGSHNFCIAHLRQRSHESDTLVLQCRQTIRAHPVETYRSQQVIDLRDPVLEPRDSCTCSNTYDNGLARESCQPPFDCSRAERLIGRSGISTSTWLAYVSSR
jgi:hypothetical protein